MFHPDEWLGRALVGTCEAIDNPLPILKGLSGGSLVGWRIRLGQNIRGSFFLNSSCQFEPSLRHGYERYPVLGVGYAICNQ